MWSHTPIVIEKERIEITLTENLPATMQHRLLQE